MKLYRYSDFIAENGLNLRLEEFPVVRSTELTYFIKRNPWSNRFKQCRKQALRSFTYDTKEKAFESYIARKKKQYQHADVAMQTASMALKSAYEVRDSLTPNTWFGSKSSDATMGFPEFHDTILFDQTPSRAPSATST